MTEPTIELEDIDFGRAKRLSLIIPSSWYTRVDRPKVDVCIFMIKFCFRACKELIR